MSGTLCWYNGAILPVHEARVPVLDHGLLYGDGVFEGIRFYHGRTFRLARHLARLQASAAAIRLAIPLDAAALARAVGDTVAAFGRSEGYLRLIVTRGEGRLGIDPSGCARPNVLIIADELTALPQRVRREGARVIVVATRRPGPDGLDPRIKSLNYLNHVLARLEATHAGADEAILLNGQGRVAEASAENVFIVRGGELLTPPAIDGALEGVTREAILQFARELGISAVERSLAAYDLHTAGECFLTGTGAELVPVREVDGRPLGACPGPVYRRVAEAFHALVERETRDRSGATTAATVV